MSVLFEFQNNIKVESVEILKQVPQCPVPFFAPPSAPTSDSVAPTSGPAIIQQTTGSQTSGSQHSGIYNAPPHSMGAPMAASQQQPTGSDNVTNMVPSSTGQTVGAPAPQVGFSQFSNPVQPGAIPGLQPPAPPGSATGSAPNTSTFPGQDSNHVPSAVLNPQSSVPAMLPVTQLPSGGVSHPVSSHAMDDDDDFADFQAAAPSPITTLKSPTGSLNSPPHTGPRYVLKWLRKPHH